MKNFLYSAFILAVVILTACSNDDNGETQPKRGMTLNASVENLSSRATMTDESGTWKFAFTENDKVSVSNSKISTYYTFTNNGSLFTSTDATATTEAVDWYAYFPSDEVDLTNQSGTFADVANKFAVAGKTAEATTGENNLSITLMPKVAVLCIVEVDKEGILDINVKTDGKWVTGLTAKKDAADFTVSKSDTKASLLQKGEDEVKECKIYYVTVPAGVKIEIYNGGKLLKKTKDAGLTAGKYYTITTGPTTGTEDALIKGVVTPVNWVQLWPGGPRFATKNVAEEMTWTDAASKKYWGENWRTPTAEEVEDKNGGGLQYDWNNLKIKEGSPTVTINTSADGTEEVVLTGVQPGYTKNTLTLYNKVGNDGYSHFDFWTTTPGSDENKGSQFQITTYYNKDENYHGLAGMGISPLVSKDKPYLVRPVLSIQNITQQYITNNNK